MVLAKWYRGPRTPCAGVRVLPYDTVQSNERDTFCFYTEPVGINSEKTRPVKFPTAL